MRKYQDNRHYIYGSEGERPCMGGNWKEANLDGLAALKRKISCMLQFASSICKWVAGVEQLLEAAGTLPSERQSEQQAGRSRVSLIPASEQTTCFYSKTQHLRTQTFYLLDFHCLNHSAVEKSIQPNNMFENSNVWKKYPSNVIKLFSLFLEFWQRSQETWFKSERTSREILRINRYTAVHWR